MIKSNKKILTSKFDMIGIGIADVILRIKIIRTSKELILSQYYYVEKILNKFDKNSDSVTTTHVDVNLYLSKNTREGVSQVEYS